MSELAGILERFGAAVGGWVASMTVAASLLLATAVVLDWLLASRVTASARLWLYLAVAARLALPADWQTPLGLLGGRAATAAVQEGAPVLLAAPGGPPVASLGASGWIAIVYLLVALGLLASWARARLALRRQLRWARPVHPDVATLLPGARVLEHPSLGPLAVGVLHPRVVLPVALVAKGPTDALRCVLRHEGAHLQRRDQLLMAGLQLLCALAWPILPLWIAAARIRALIELASDEHALAGADASGRRRYGEVLLALAAGETAEGARLAFVPSFGGALRGRLRALAFSRRWPRPLQLALVAVVGAAAFACAGVGEPASGDDDAAPTPSLSAAAGGDPIRTPVTGATAAGHQPPRPADSIASIATVRGSLDKEIIRRVIRRHIKQALGCYEQQLEARPGLAGRIAVQFTIAATGRVTESVIESSTMSDPVVETCLAEAVRGWEFPKPAGGGIVIVTYPFMFTPKE